MGFAYYDVGTRPKPFDVVWSKWPLRGELKPGPTVRPVLVLDSTLMEDSRTGDQFAAVVAQYGGDFTDAHLHRNFHIGEQEYRDLGLHKSTVFRLDLGNRKRLPWCKEYFITQSYVRNQHIIAGTLNATQQARVLECLRARNLSFPVPQPEPVS